MDFLDQISEKGIINIILDFLDPSMNLACENKNFGCCYILDKRTKLSKPPRVRFTIVCSSLKLTNLL